VGYPELAQVLRRRGVIQGGLGQQQMAELFRRMVFNILMDNTDDHEKNHVVLVNDRNEYELSPAFDVLPSGQALGYQQMRVGIDQADSTIENAMSEYQYFGLNRTQACEQVRLVVHVVGGWREHFAACGVTPNNIEALGQQIDRAYLYDQRLQWT
jgi:serine/threonine-protein kinase HipA